MLQRARKLHLTHRAGMADVDFRMVSTIIARTENVDGALMPALDERPASWSGLAGGSPAVLNPILRGWGDYFRTGNAADKFRQIDRYLWWRLFRLMVKRRGRDLRPGQADQWTEQWFNDHGLSRLRGAIRYPKAA